MRSNENRIGRFSGAHLGIAQSFAQNLVLY